MSIMQRSRQDIKVVKDITGRYDFIRYALLFGSQAGEEAHPMSDFDIAIAADREIDLMQLGEIVSRLEAALDSKVDILLLNELPRKDPLLAYNIYRNHTVILLRDREAYERFKLEALHSYMDFQPVLREQQAAFLKRIADGTLAQTPAA
jgi:predicted nucleotidyltransferase